MQNEKPLMIMEVVESLAALGDQVAEHPELAGKLPPELVRSARRFVDLTGFHGLPGEQVAVVPMDGMAVGQLVVQLIRPGEVVGAGTLCERLAATGRKVPVGSITTALHRAVAQGLLERASPGRYSRVGCVCECTCECTHGDNVSDPQPEQVKESVRLMAIGHR